MTMKSIAREDRWTVFPLALIGGEGRGEAVRFIWRTIALVACGVFSIMTIQPARAAIAGAEHVVVIGVDGLNPNGIVKADTPNLDKLVKTGAHTFHARAVMPTSSSPNWASMIMGAGPEQHGVWSNEWQPWKFDRSPVAVGSGGIFPTIFGVMREQQQPAEEGEPEPDEDRPMNRMKFGQVHRQAGGIDPGQPERGPVGRDGEPPAQQQPAQVDESHPGRQQLGVVVQMGPRGREGGGGGHH